MLTPAFLPTAEQLGVCPPPPPPEDLNFGSFTNFLERNLKFKTNFQRISLDHFADYTLGATVAGCSSGTDLQVARDECEKAFKGALPHIINTLADFDSKCVSANDAEAKGRTPDFHATRVWAQEYWTTRDQIWQHLDQAQSEALRAIRRHFSQSQRAREDFASYKAGVQIKLAKG